MQEAVGQAGAASPLSVNVSLHDMQISFRDHVASREKWALLALTGCQERMELLG